RRTRGERQRRSLAPPTVSSIHRGLTRRSPARRRRSRVPFADSARPCCGPASRRVEDQGDAVNGGAARPLDVEWSVVNAAKTVAPIAGPAAAQRAIATNVASGKPPDIVMTTLRGGGGRGASALGFGASRAAAASPVRLGLLARRLRRA